MANFFKKLITFNFPISDEVAEGLSSMLITDGYLDSIHDYHFEIYNFFHDQVLFYIDEGKIHSVSESNAIIDTCDLYKIHRVSLWRIRKKLDSCKATQR